VTPGREWRVPHSNHVKYLFCRFRKSVGALQVILKATFSVYIQPFAVKKKILKIPNAKSKKDRQQHGEKKKENLQNIAQKK
jgi:hypothetical protein